MSSIFLVILLLLSSCTLPLSYSTHVSPHRTRRVLHQPFFPLTSIPPSPMPSPSSSPPQPQLPNLPSSFSPPFLVNPPFFPSVSPPSLSPPPPPPHPLSSSISTPFPANISSLVLPESPSPRKSISTTATKLLAVGAAVFSISLVSVLILILYYRRHRRFAAGKSSRSDSLRLYPANSATSNGGSGRHKSPPRGGASGTSSEFLYLGTLVVNSRGGGGAADEDNNATTCEPKPQLGSPELSPLPPLPRQNVQPCAEVGSSSMSSEYEEDENEEEEFYSPRGASSSGGGKERADENFGGSSRRSSCCFNSPTPSYPSSYSNSNSPPTLSTTTYNINAPKNSSPRSSDSKSPDSIIKILSPPLRPPPRKNPITFSPSPPSSALEIESPARISDYSQQSPRESSPQRIESVFSGQEHEHTPILSPTPPPLPPPPPPPHPMGSWETPTTPVVTREPTISGPPVLVTPSRQPIVFQNPPSLLAPPVSEGVGERCDDTSKPKLKPLHWDKVRASSDRAMVWDQLKSNSFKLNEEMIETLFMVNGSNLAPKDHLRRAVLATQNQGNQVLDPKKSQNIAILLRALNVTIDEVCEALLNGNADTLGTELLESLLKMAPTQEEECKLKEFKDESPIKLGPAERFLKAVIDVPFAFKRVDAMLYIANFDPEVEFLDRCFETLEVACKELRNSRMFLKLLEAVLKTGNRMNVGTNRGDARAFKLDTLLKLVDVKGGDGKTSLLHFVVQEIIRAEGSRLSGANQNQTGDKTSQSALRDDVEFRKHGLQVVSSLSGELTNVKKAAAMDSDVLGRDASKLAAGITKVRGVVELMEELVALESSRKFSRSINGFLQKAEEEIVRIQAQEKAALSLVKELTVYFHGNSAKEEAHPFRIFTVVRDFLSTLDHVCKEVGKINERTTVSSGRQFPQPVNPAMPPVFLGFNGTHQYISSDDESSSSSSS